LNASGASDAASKSVLLNAPARFRPCSDPRGASRRSRGNGQTLLFVTVSIWKTLQPFCTRGYISASIACIGQVAGSMMEASVFHCAGPWWCLMLLHEPSPTSTLFAPPFMLVKFRFTYMSMSASTHALLTSTSCPLEVVPRKDSSSSRVASWHEILSAMRETTFRPRTVFSSSRLHLR